jgi:hypothetical protein
VRTRRSCRRREPGGPPGPGQLLHQPQPPAALGLQVRGDRSQRPWAGVADRDEEPVGPQLQPQPQVAAGVDHGVGDQLVGHQHGPVHDRLVGAGELPGPADLPDKGAGDRGRGRDRRQPQLIAQMGRPGRGRLQGLLDAVVQRHQARGPRPAQRLGHLGLGATQQEAGGRPAVGGMVRHRREHGGEHRVQVADAGQVADQGGGLVAEVLEQGPLDPGDAGEVDAAGEGDDDAALLGGVLDLHAHAPLPPRPCGPPRTRVAPSTSPFCHSREVSSGLVRHQDQLPPSP